MRVYKRFLTQDKVEELYYNLKDVSIINEILTPLIGEIDQNSFLPIKYTPKDMICGRTVRGIPFKLQKIPPIHTAEAFLLVCVGNRTYLYFAE